MHKFILMQGIPGSGKSTWAKEWISKDSEHRVRWNRDDIRNMLGKYWLPSREKLINELEDKFIMESIKQGYDIIIDNMNLNPKILSCYTNLINNTKNGDNYNIIVEQINTPLEICLERDKQRENPIGANVIKEIYNKYKDILND